MLARYLKAQLTVLLCGGLVGPIFLIIYFAMGPMNRQYIQWMFYVGLLITAADVLIALALANANAKSQAQTQTLEQSGVLTLAQITGMGETGMRVNDVPVVKLNLHIEGPGITPFDSQTRTRLPVTQQGNIASRKLVVLVNPATNNYQIDWQRSALVNGLVPAQFTIAEDNKTYDLSGQAGPLMEILQILKADNVPFNGTVDLRSNPAVRQQVLSVIRRSATQPAQTAQSSAPAAEAAPVLTPPGPSIAQRLQELETLRATGAISDAEYNAKRQQIISQI
ncbi:MAG TPA: SHOCT domain-containing protein [Mycobacterium sp.]|nr:SHOCT domain-containing protein [Mycobacterium sp.]